MKSLWIMRLLIDARLQDVVGAVNNVAADLWDWSKNTLGDLEKCIKHTKKALEACRRCCITKDNVAREEILKYELEKLEDQKELYWRQRAKAHWLQHGDRNTKYFHQHASERRRLNRIQKLVRDDGSVVKQIGEIHTMVTDLFKSLFQSHAGNR